MKICINGILATPNELQELERNLRLGTMRAFGRICRGFVYLRTEVISK
jgi:hypothetical protein